MNESEAKSYLHQHKLKYTLLSGSFETVEEEETDAPPKPKDKKTKKEKAQKSKATTTDNTKSTTAGKIQPMPLITFQALRQDYNISRRLYNNIISQGFASPTDVQTGSLPLLLHSNSDQDAALGLNGLKDHNVHLITVAPTGSGKTLAYAIPLIDSLMRRRKQIRSQSGDEGVKDNRGIKAIVLSPTRELASQIVNEFRKLVEGTGISVIGMKKSMLPGTKRANKGLHMLNDGRANGDDSDSDTESEGEGSGDENDEEWGGISDADEDKNLPKIADERISAAKYSPVKSDILVATPLLLLHAIQKFPVIINVEHVRYVVLDEADALLDDLFKDQTIPITKSLTSSDLQYTFWSATMSSTAESLATSIIQTQGELSSAPTVVRLIAGIKDTSLPTIVQKITYTATERGKLLALRQLFKTSLQTPCLIFVQTIARAQALHAEILYDLPTPGRIAVLHSNLTEHARERVMDSFRAGEVWILITTDLLSRGVDFRGVRLVINYDIPTSVASYIHRIGRTGRAGRDNGQALTYFTEEDVPYVRGIVGVMEKSGGAEGLQDWMLKSLPKTKKEDKKKLKKYGVEERQTKKMDGNKSNHGNNKSRISSKSGYERQKEHKKKAAVENSKRRKLGLDSNIDSD